MTLPPLLWTLAKTPFCSQGIFDDDMQVVTGPREYNWTLIDQSWDYQVGLGLTPVVELSFMPVRPFYSSPVAVHTFTSVISSPFAGHPRGLLVAVRTGLGRSGG